ncbi:hypothetical protein FD755_000014 [Muntiacus reevesi]|uniref:Uncharacterized protein n=1 Tax=Muntiacus reevesi TaxID=9886 RepID=A0A5J5MWS7_MUNRE|nr:hypothetical protein FD755_000014 [Muntiacus reevesi]
MDLTIQTEITSHLQDVEKVKETQGAEVPSDEGVKAWSDHEIRSFLEEWELLEGEALENFHVASKIIARHLKQRGIIKSKRKCLQMLISMHDLYWTIHEVNQKPRNEPLPCPYGGTLHRIFGHRLEIKEFSGYVVSSCFPCTSFSLSLSCPPGAEVAALPPPVYQPPACATPDHFEELSWTPPLMIYIEDPHVPGWEPWNMNLPQSSPFPFLAFLLPYPGPQPPWSPTTPWSSATEVSFF